MAHSYNNKKIIFILLILFLFSGYSSWAHTINYTLENAPTGSVIWFYLELGIQHIIPFGIDHILFIVALCSLSTNIKTIFWLATAFTVAHSIKLALSMKNIISLTSDIVEPMIALSILFVAVENIILSELKAWRIFIVFIFGLIHGLGFASALNEIGLPRNKFLTSILSFNVGVELGQISVILAVFFLLVLPFGKRNDYRKWIVSPLSVIIGMTALYWTIQRVFFV